MKTKAPVLVALVALALGGCNSSIRTASPVVINPRPPVTAETEGMKISDVRRVTVGPNLTPRPDYTEIIDWIHVLPGQRKIADLVASVVATRYPRATVVLHELELPEQVGAWANTTRCVLTVDVTPPGRRTITIHAEGRNKNVLGGPKNAEAAIERALADLAEKLASTANLQAQ